MRKHVFTAIGISFGLISGSLVVAGIEWLSAIIFPYAVIDPKLRASELEKLFTQIPVEALIMVQLAWIMGVWIGSGVASYFAYHARKVAAALVGILLFSGAIFNLFAMPHPVWFVISTWVVYPLFTYAGYRTGKRVSGDTK